MLDSDSGNVPEQTPDCNISILIMQSLTDPAGATCQMAPKIVRTVKKSLMYI